jgi:hypothetical protein
LEAETRPIKTDTAESQKNGNAASGTLTIVNRLGSFFDFVIGSQC